MKRIKTYGTLIILIWIVFFAFIAIADRNEALKQDTTKTIKADTTKIKLEVLKQQMLKHNEKIDSLIQKKKK